MAGGELYASTKVRSQSDHCFLFIQQMLIEHLLSVQASAGQNSMSLLSWGSQPMFWWGSSDCPLSLLLFCRRGGVKEL